MCVWWVCSISSIVWPDQVYILEILLGAGNFFNSTYLFICPCRRLSCLLRSPPPSPPPGLSAHCTSSSITPIILVFAFTSSSFTPPFSSSFTYISSSSSLPAWSHILELTFVPIALLGCKFHWPVRVQQNSWPYDNGTPTSSILKVYKHSLTLLYTTRLFEVGLVEWEYEDELDVIHPTGN